PAFRRHNHRVEEGRNVDGALPGDRRLLPVEDLSSGGMRVNRGVHVYRDENARPVRIRRLRPGRELAGSVGDARQPNRHPDLLERIGERERVVEGDVLLLVAGGLGARVVATVPRVDAYEGRGHVSPSGARPTLIARVKMERNGRSPFALRTLSTIEATSR